MLVSYTRLERNDLYQNLRFAKVYKGRELGVGELRTSDWVQQALVFARLQNGA
jgi:hypothetical protein